MKCDDLSSIAQLQLFFGWVGRHSLSPSPNSVTMFLNSHDHGDVVVSAPPSTSCFFTSGCPNYQRISSSLNFCPLYLVDLSKVGMELLSLFLAQLLYQTSPFKALLLAFHGCHETNQASFKSKATSFLKL